MSRISSFLAALVAALLLAACAGKPPPGGPVNGMDEDPSAFEIGQGIQRTALMVSTESIAITNEGGKTVKVIAFCGEETMRSAAFHYTGSETGTLLFHQRQEYCSIIIQGFRQMMQDGVASVNAKVAMGYGPIFGEWWSRTLSPPLQDLAPYAGIYGLYRAATDRNPDTDTTTIDVEGGAGGSASATGTGFGGAGGQGGAGGSVLPGAVNVSAGAQATGGVATIEPGAINVGATATATN